MKKIIYIIALSSLGTFPACTKIIDLNPISNIGANSYYNTQKDVQTALTGCYDGLQSPLQEEWMLTELRSDNSLQGIVATTNTTRLDFNQLDMFMASPTLPEIYDYWLAVYKNIRSINYVLRSLGINYDGTNITEGNMTAAMAEEERKQLAGEALFLRAYHYFNLVRVFGGVFLLTEPTTPQESQHINRSSVEEMYALIEADLKAARNYLPRTTFGNIPKDDLGKANVWSVEALLAKVYLTENKKTEALALLNDVITNSGYGLESSFADVFSTGNEMNKEIIFAVRFKAGGLGLGNFMPNDFAPQGSGAAVVNGDGNGYNYPAHFLDSAFSPQDQRFDFSIGKYQDKLYAKKFVVPVAVADDGENDFPVIRFADVLLMKAEATGFDGAAGTSVGIINQIRERAGATNYISGDFDAGFYKYPADQNDANAITDADEFMTAYLNERRLELAFENQRLFDLIRTGQAVAVMQKHFEEEYPIHYSLFQPQLTLAELKSNIKKERMILPIPQREIDANTTIVIPQNEDY